MAPRTMIRSNFDTCKRGTPIIKLMGYERREDAVWGGRSRQWQTHTKTHTHTHTQTVFPVIHRVDGASGNDRTRT